jgi:hypothetical protein
MDLRGSYTLVAYRGVNYLLPCCHNGKYMYVCNRIDIFRIDPGAPYLSLQFILGTGLLAELVPAKTAYDGFELLMSQILVSIR